MHAGIYFPLFLVQIASSGRGKAIFYLPADLQLPAMFRARKALSKEARRAGWQGFLYDFSARDGLFTRLL